MPASGQNRPINSTFRPLSQTSGPDADTPLEQVRLTIGSIVGVHGVGGELKLRLATDDPEHLRAITRVWVGDEGQSRRLIGFRLHAGMALITLSGIRSKEEGLSLASQPVRISGKDARPLEPGEYYLYQVIGVTVLSEHGESIGTVTDVIETGANDVFVVTAPNGPEHLFPNVPEVILELEPAAKRMVVRRLKYWGDPEASDIPDKSRTPGV